jgi:23S rRNA pseudouridine2605 synthase
MPGIKPGMTTNMTDSKRENIGGQHRGRKFRGKRLKTALPRPETGPAPAAAKSAERIAKVMARAGLASRREAEAWIEAGRVSVNGAVISSPALNVTPQDRISVDGKPLPQRERTRLFLFHKPRGLVTTSADTHGRPTIFGALPKGMPRLISVGRLDLNTEGLLLLTNDGGLARALELPSTGWLRRYRVRAFGKATQAQLDGLKNGITVDGVNYGAIEARLDREQGSNVWITFAMREGKNREIRNVLRALGLQVNRLIRVSFGPFQLGELPDGAVEEVKTRTLRDQLGPRLAAQAGADFSSEIVERDEPRAAISPRHLEVRDGDGGRASKGGGLKRRSEQVAKPGGRPSFEGRLRRPPHDDGSKGAPRRDKPKKGRRPYRGKRDR